MQEREETIGGRYRLQRYLGQGSMSMVYLATDEHMHRNVAVKLVSSYGEYGKRFQREVKSLSLLRHSHILPILDHGEYDSWYYLVMPYIEYGTLHDRLTKGLLAPEEVGDILVQLADALQHMHNHGIIHRDIKPSNILLHEGRYVYLADFGLARLIVEDERITQIGLLMGTPEYIAPELMDGLLSASSDIYALGVLLYQMLTGRLPFRGSTIYEICWKHVQEQPVPLSLLNPAIPHPIEQVILCALEKDPRHRFASARAISQAYLRALAASHQPETLAMQVSTLTEGSPPRQNMPLLLRMLLAFVFLIIAFLSLGFCGATIGAHLQVPAVLRISAQLQLASKNRP